MEVNDHVRDYITKMLPNKIQIIVRNPSSEFEKSPPWSVRILWLPLLFFFSFSRKPSCFEVLKRDREKSLFKRTRVFAPANAIYPNENFYIEPTILDMAGSSLLEGKCSLICGHRQSGKSTTCQALLRWFIENQKQFKPIDEGYYPDINEEELDPKHGLYYGYEIFLVNLDSTVVVNKGCDIFWHTLCRNLEISDRERFALGGKQGDVFEFKRFFSKTNLAKPRPVILLIDEASRLIPGDDAREVINEFISALKTLKDDHTNHCIYSIVLCGTESIKDLLVYGSVNHPLLFSPFSYTICWKCGRFTESDVKELLDQFAKTKPTNLDVSEIASDIFALTLGHRGLTGACCGYIEESYKSGETPIVTLDDWKSQTIVNLQNEIRGMATYRSIIQRLPHLSETQRFMFGTVLRFGVHKVSP
ncbi:ATP-dependent RNA helicase, partial [Entomortierella lignicola]